VWLRALGAGRVVRRALRIVRILLHARISGRTTRWPCPTNTSALRPLTGAILLLRRQALQQLEVFRARAPLPCRPRPRPRALARDGGCSTGRGALRELEGHAGAFPRGTAGPCGPRKLRHVCALAPVEARPHGVELAPPTDVLEHHLAIISILVRPIDHNGGARDVVARHLLELHLEDSRIRPGDLLEALEDAIEVGVAAGATVTDHHHSGALRPRRARRTVVVQGCHPVAQATLLALPESWSRVADRAVEARAQIGWQHGVRHAVHGVVRVLALRPDQRVLCGPHRQDPLGFGP